MNVSGENSKEIFELFTNKLVFSESVSQGWSCRSWLAISSLDAPLARSASLRIMIIMKEFLFSICFISLSSNLQLSIDIFIMSVRHVFAEFQFIFVKRSCSRRDGRKRIMFVFFILYKHNVLLILWVHTNKSRPVAVPNDVLLLPSGVVVPGEVGILLIYAPNFFFIFFLTAQQRPVHKEWHVKLVLHI